MKRAPPSSLPPPTPPLQLLLCERNCKWAILFGFLCFSMYCVMENTRTPKLHFAANIKSGFIKFSIHLCSLRFVVNAPRENFETKWKCKTRQRMKQTTAKQQQPKRKKNRSVLSFSFGFPIQLYGFVCPKR